MPLKLYQRGEIWHYAGTVCGKRLRGSTKTAIKEIAEQHVFEKERRIWKGYFDPQGNVTFAQAAMIYREAGKSDRFLQRIEDYWQNTLIKDMKPGNIRAAAQKLYPNAGRATQNRQVIVPTTAIINNAAEHGLCPHIRVKRFQVKRAKVKVPATWEWVRAFMDACYAVDKPRLAASACLMFLTGARISQAIAIQWADVDFQEKKVLIRATDKGDDDRLAHMQDALIVALANITGERVGRVFGFDSRQNCQTQWDEVVKAAALKRLTPHCCRHGFATGLLERGVSPVTVARRGGWKSAQHVLTTYGHDIAREDITDVLTDTPLTQQTRKRNAIN